MELFLWNVFLRKNINKTHTLKNTISNFIILKISFFFYLYSLYIIGYSTLFLILRMIYIFKSDCYIFFKYLVFDKNTFEDKAHFLQSLSNDILIYAFESY